MSLLTVVLFLIGLVVGLVIALAMLIYVVYKTLEGFQLHMGVNTWHSYEECLSFGYVDFVTDLLLEPMFTKGDLDARLADGQAFDGEGSAIDSLPVEVDELVVKYFIHQERYEFLEYRLIRRGGRRGRRRLGVGNMIRNLIPRPAAIPV